MASKQVKRGGISPAIKKRLIETKSIILYPPRRWLWEHPLKQGWHSLREPLFLGCPTWLAPAQGSCSLMLAFMSENKHDFFPCAPALQLLVPASHPSSYMLLGCGQCPSGPGLTSRARGCCLWVSAY